MSQKLYNEDNYGTKNFMMRRPFVARKEWGNLLQDPLV